jgi:hypothetical protein
LAFPWACAQDAPPRIEVFAESGASFLNNGTAQFGLIACPDVCGPSGCIPCPVPGTVTGTFSETGRLIAGARLRFTRHDAIEASYSYSPNHLSFQEGSQSLGSGYTRLDVISFNYVRYLSIGTRLQPFATAGIGINRFSGGPAGTALPVGSDSGWQFAGNYGGGADILLLRAVVLRVELRDYVTGQPSIFTGTSHNIVPSAGIVFRFK